MSLDIYFKKNISCPHCGNVIHTEEESFWKNITHNLGQMAEEAGIYGILWHPEENNVNRVGDMIAPLENGIHQMKADPSRFKAFDASNGWGNIRSVLTLVGRAFDSLQGSS